MSDYIDQIKNKLGFDKDDDLKFTHGSINLLLDTKISSITKTVPIGVLKKHSNPQKILQQQLITQEEKYTLSEIHTMLPFFFLYLRLKDPSMFNILAQSRDTNSFVNMILHPKYLELTKIMMRQSVDISNARKQKNDDGLLDCKITIPDPPTLEELAKQSDIKFDPSNPSNNILTEMDLTKILLLQKYGYTYETVKEYFIKFNRNFNTTLEYLKTNVSEETECTIESIN